MMEAKTALLDTDVIANWLLDEISLLRANKLQSQYPLDPFDAVLLSLALSDNAFVLISRDVKFLGIASRLIEAFSPEQFLANTQ